MRIVHVAVAVLWTVASQQAWGDSKKGVELPRVAPPGLKEKCPVCGMFVAKHRAWLATVSFSDGSRAVFDGAKDLFKFWLEPTRYLPGRQRRDVTSLSVTDYYAVAPLDARRAFFVWGSDVHGPMGPELVPFAKRDDAEEFGRDHHGARILRFDEVTLDALRALDE